MGYAQQVSGLVGKLKNTRSVTPRLLGIGAFGDVTVAEQRLLGALRTTLLLGAPLVNKFQDPDKRRPPML